MKMRFIQAFESVNLDTFQNAIRDEIDSSEMHGREMESIQFQTTYNPNLGEIVYTALVIFSLEEDENA